ncbi:MAG: hypothetical protein QOH39_3540 [Verrucomicrobiota bacterium]|jgi:hypothetical protein
MVRRPDPHLYLAIAIGVLAVGIRLPGITQPFVDEWSWRQSDVAAIARNYLLHGFHFAYPQIDWAGGEPGYVGTEFPILPFIAAFSYKLAGVQEWIGRGQAVLFFAVSLPFFFLLVSELLGTATAVWALFFYSFAPLNLMTSRCFMPDMPSLSLSLIGLYLFSRWMANGKWFSFCAAALAISFALLIKLPTVLIGAPLLYLASERFGRRVYRQWTLWLFAIISLVPSILWYWHAHEIAMQFYPHHFFGAGGVRLMTVAWYWTIAKQTFIYSLTPLLCVLATAGLLAAKGTPRAGVFYSWLAAMLLFIVIAGYGNRHPWYRLPLVPIAAVFASCVAQNIWSRLAPFRSLKVGFGLVAVTVFASEGYSAAQQLYRASAADLRALGLELKQRTPQKSLVIVADYGDPTALYYAERKGWHFLEKEGIYNGHPNTSADAISDLDQLRSRGATHIAFYSETFWWLDYYKEFAEHLAKTATLVDATQGWMIYELSPRPDQR